MSSKMATFLPYEVKEHLIQSKFVAQAYTIKVMLPMRRADNSERFPVLYLTDGDDFFGGAVNMGSSMQMHGEAARFILVGVGYKNVEASGMLRTRDFWTHANRSYLHADLEKLGDTPLSGGINVMETVTRTTDAVEYLRFFREELMPLIDGQYPVVPGDSNYYGYSAGGTFGFHTLFNQSETFKRYILGSPGTSYKGSHFGIEMAKAFISSGRRLQAQLYMSVGELEEFGRGLTQFDLTTGYYLMAKFLQQAGIPGLQLTLKVFPEETHATAWMPAFTHGVKALFGAVDRVPFMPESFHKK